MKISYFLSILVMVLMVELSETRWLQLGKCSQLETEQNTMIYLNMSGNNQVHYEGRSIISCIEIEGKARNCDVRCDAGGLGKNFLNISSHSSDCKLTNSKVKLTLVDTFEPASMLSMRKWVLADIILVSTSPVPGMYSLVVTLSVLLGLVVLWGTIYVAVDHVCRGRQQWYHVDEREGAKVEASDDEFPDYENIWEHEKK